MGQLLNMGKEQQHWQAKAPSLGEGESPAAALLVLNSFKTFRRLKSLGHQGFCSPLVEGFTFDRWKNSPRHFCIKAETSTRHRGRIHRGKVEENTCPTGMKCALRRKKAPSQSARGALGRPAPSMKDGSGRGILKVADAFAQFGWKETPPWVSRDTHWGGRKHLLSDRKVERITSPSSFAKRWRALLTQLPPSV